MRRDRGKTGQRRRCISGKVRFRSEVDAKIALMEAGSRHSRKNADKVEVRYYLHDRGPSACGGYHITSQTLDEYRAQIAAFRDTHDPDRGRSPSADSTRR